MSESEIPEGDYVLSEGGAWFTARATRAGISKSLSIRIVQIDGDMDCFPGLEVSVYKLGEEDGAPIDSFRISEVDDGVFISS